MSLVNLILYSDYSLVKRAVRATLISILKFEKEIIIIIINKQNPFSQVKRAVRATLILFPLLGMTNLLFFINPKTLNVPEHQ